MLIPQEKSHAEERKRQRAEVKAKADAEAREAKAAKRAEVAARRAATDAVFIDVVRHHPESMSLSPERLQTETGSN